MSREPTVPTTTVTVTEAAIERVRRLLEERQLPGHALRVFVSGGGCSGLQYGMALEGNPRADDHRSTHGDIQVVIDPVSLSYLQGATIDFVDEVMGGGFRIDNPNAVNTCNCGQSFRGNGEGPSGMGQERPCG